MEEEQGKERAMMVWLRDDDDGDDDDDDDDDEAITWELLKKDGDVGRVELCCCLCC